MTALPHSGRVLQVMVEVFDLDLAGKVPPRIRRTLSRYFAGDSLTFDVLQDVFRWTAKVLLGTDLFPEPVLLVLRRPTTPILPGGPSAEELLALALFRFARVWDELVGTLACGEAAGRMDRAGAAAFLRLAIVDLAVRIGAAHGLAGTVPSEQLPGVGPVDAPASTLLRSLLARCTPAVTGDEIAASLEVSANTMYSWLSLDAAVRPKVEHIGLLAEELADRISGTTALGLRRQLWLNYSLHALTRHLVAELGTEFYAEFIGPLVRLARNTTQFLASSSARVDTQEWSKAHLVLWGSFWQPHVGYLLNHLIKQERDPVWCADLAAARDGRWLSRFEYLARVFGGAGSSGRDQIRERFGLTESQALELEAAAERWLTGEATNSQILEETFRRHPAFKAQLFAIRADAAYSQDNLEQAVADWQRAATLDPQHADHHFRLGAVLAQARRVEEGLVECHLACSLRPGWELPGVEIGIILLEAGRAEAGREHLEEILRTEQAAQRRGTGHLRYHLAVARFRTRDFKGALVLLEQIVREEPDRATAFDLAAHAAFHLGQRQRGATYARRARALGLPGSALHWGVK